MELELPIELEELKSKYKDLVKLNHPDRNGGDKESEERLKIINQAYTTLKQYLKNPSFAIWHRKIHTLT